MIEILVQKHTLRPIKGIFFAERKLFKVISCLIIKMKILFWKKKTLRAI